MGAGLGPNWIAWRAHALIKMRLVSAGPARPWRILVRSLFSASSSTERGMQRREDATGLSGPSFFRTPFGLLSPKTRRGVDSPVILVFFAGTFTVDGRL